MNKTNIAHGDSRNCDVYLKVENVLLHVHSSSEENWLYTFTVMIRKCEVSSEKCSYIICLQVFCPNMATCILNQTAEANKKLKCFNTFDSLGGKLAKRIEKQREYWRLMSVGLFQGSALIFSSSLPGLFSLCPLWTPLYLLSLSPALYTSSLCSCKSYQWLVLGFWT